MIIVTPFALPSVHGSGEDDAAALLADGCFLCLLLFWFQSVRARLLPSRAKTRMLGATLMMLLYQLLRIFKYRFAVEPDEMRYAVYLYQRGNRRKPVHDRTHSENAYLEHLLEKTGCRNRIDLAVDAKALGWAVLEDARMENRRQNGGSKP